MFVEYFEYFEYFIKSLVTGSYIVRTKFLSDMLDTELSEKSNNELIEEAGEDLVLVRSVQEVVIVIL